MAKQHWVTPISGRTPPSEHLIVWCGVDGERKGKAGQAVVLKPTFRRAWPMRLEKGGVHLDDPRMFDDSAGLADMILSAVHGKRPLTVWMPRGWTDLVMSGFTELVDEGRYAWKYLTLDGAKCQAKGALDGKSVNLTSLASWTGGTWDAWRSNVSGEYCSPLVIGLEAMSSAISPAVNADELCAIGTANAVLSGSALLQTGRVCLSVGAQARGWWRAWGGPQINECPAPPDTKARKKPAKPGVFIAPLPSRPHAAAAAERHACYGLPREQYYRGHVGGRVVVADLRSAYLAALASMPQPLCYRGRIGPCGGAALQHALADSTGCALVMIDSARRPYPVRRAGRPRRAIGRFWTWLAGYELVEACEQDAVAECHCAWLWHYVQLRRSEAMLLVNVASELGNRGLHYLSPFWRSLYSSAVGGWAQWDRKWVDDPRSSHFGPWSTWVAGDGQTGELTRFRAIAGRVQKRVDSGDAPHAVPIMYACVTAMVRCVMATIIDALPAGSILAQMADALWLTRGGEEALAGMAMAEGSGPFKLISDRVYSDAWLDGQGRAVVEYEGALYPILTGVPSWSEVGEDGRSRWMTTAPWSGASEPRARKGVRLHGAVFDGGRLVRENSDPLVRADPFVRLLDPGIPEELMRPFERARMKGGEDDTSQV